LFLIWRIVYISRFVLMSISNKLMAIFHSLKIKIAIDFCCLFMRLNILAYIISISWFLWRFYWLIICLEAFIRYKQFWYWRIREWFL
jgi:hypothetical protein